MPDQAVKRLSSSIGESTPLKMPRQSVTTQRYQTCLQPMPLTPPDPLTEPTPTRIQWQEPVALQRPLALGTWPDASATRGAGR